MIIKMVFFDPKNSDFGCFGTIILHDFWSLSEVILNETYMTCIIIPKVLYRKTSKTLSRIWSKTGQI